MVTVVGVRFRGRGRVYYFNPEACLLRRGDYVIVDTANGPAYGLVATDPRLASEEDIVQPLKSVIRLATEADAAQFEANTKKEADAMAICQQKVTEHGLEMNLVGVEYNFDASKILFYFTADSRVDFRELVKDLASTFHTRIELRQIGVRDEARMTGGVGICGREFCCSSFLTDFQPVNVSWAKHQNLPLNPTKISGSCGRLMCCLKYEDEVYTELSKNLPGEGDTVKTPDGEGEVLYVSPLKQLVKVGVTQEKGDAFIKEYPLDEISILKRRRRKNDSEADEKALKELEKD